MFKRQTPVDLCFQDKYILAFESEKIRFNSHLILEVENPIDIAKIKRRKLLKIFSDTYKFRITDDEIRKTHI